MFVIIGLNTNNYEEGVCMHFINNPVLDSRIL